MKVAAICTGSLVSIETVADAVFSSRMMGDGFAMIPEESRIVSPVSGEVQFLYPTGHAVGIKTDAGVEILIHVGLETFKVPTGVIQPHINIGDRVAVNDLLLTIDLEYFKAHQINVITPVVFTSGEKINDTISKRTFVAGEIIDGLVQ